MAWVIDEINSVAPAWECLGFVDPAAPHRRGEKLYDRPILGGFEHVGDLPKLVYFACGIGDPFSRAKETRVAEQKRWTAATLIQICSERTYQERIKTDGKEETLRGRGITVQTRRANCGFSVPSHFQNLK